MKQYINASRLVTKIKMLRSGKAYKSFLVVEGATDSRLYGKFIDSDSCEVMIADSKNNVTECIMTCNHDKIKGILGIVDADFWRLEAHQTHCENLFLTDHHDLECMLFESPAFESILAEYANRNKCLKFEERKKASIKAVILENTAKIGYLRWYSLLYNVGLRFSDLDFGKFVNASELEINMRELIEYVILHSKKQGLLKADKVQKEVEKLVSKQHNLWDVCCGHDLIEVFSIGLIHSFGEYNAKNLFPGNLEGSFRLAYEYEYFISTKLYRLLTKWESINSQYSVINNRRAYATIS